MEFTALGLGLISIMVTLLAIVWRSGKRQGSTDEKFEALQAGVNRNTAAITKVGQDLRTHMETEGTDMRKVAERLANIEGALNVGRK